ncbi:MAG TPA: ABC transporter ATP-binding protein [Phycisphaerae bacterium]|nr:ABC transporter ATP-binding protein [Phycisphaerae bacterium]HNU45388.1 ABC transporter ATP-binding protein [Phycisphaerae bacterium]
MGDASYMFTCDRLRKCYARVTALKEVTVAIERGTVGLLGPNGAGKSTLISVLLGQTPATAGRATVLGFDVRRRQLRIRQRIGFMPETDCFIPGLSGTGYVYYAGRLAGMRHADAMQRAHEVLDYVELGDARYRPVEEYSTGMRQRVKLAQALVHDPEVLFLDEPTNGMDPHGREVMLGLIADLHAAGISVLLSSHLLPDVERVCASVMIMGAGEVLTTGRLADLGRPHPTLYTLEYAGNGADLPGALQTAGVGVLGAPVSDNSGRVSIALELPAAGRQSLVLEAAQLAGVRVRGLHPQRSSLEETFLAAIRKQQQP